MDPAEEGITSVSDGAGTPWLAADADGWLSTVPTPLGALIDDEAAA